MKISYALASPYAFKGGSWFYRSMMPAEALIARGHEVKFFVAANSMDKEFFDFPDVVVYSRTYPFDPIQQIKEFQKKDVLVVYDTDDDYLTVNPGNPCHADVKKVTEQYISLIKAADVVTVTTDILKKRVKRFNKNVVVVPNALNFARFKDRKDNNKKLKIGYSGASSHWEDIGIVLDVISDLQKKYEFEFFIQGMCGGPLIGEIYNYTYIDKEKLEPERRDYYRSALKMYEKLKNVKFVHIPFYPPELFPEILSMLDLDIAIAPLKGNKFNEAKSAIKFFESAAIGTACLTSNVLPYRGVSNYTTNNTYKDWYKKLEKLIKDEKFRKKLAKKQWDIVRNNADLTKVVKTWERVFTK